MLPSKFLFGGRLFQFGRLIVLRAHSWLCKSLLEEFRRLGMKSGLSACKASAFTILTHLLSKKFLDKILGLVPIGSEVGQ